MLASIRCSVCICCGFGALQVWRRTSSCGTDRLIGLPFAHEVGQRRTRPFRCVLARAADVHEADDALVLGEAEERRPRRDRTRPSRSAIARRNRAPARRAAGCRRRSRPTAAVPAPESSDAGRRCARSRPRSAARSRSARDPCRSLRFGDVGVVREVDLGERVAQRSPRFAANQQQAPRRELAVVGHADRPLPATHRAAPASGPGSPS